MEPDVKAVNDLIDSFEDKIKDVDVNIGEYVTKNNKNINITNTNKTVDVSIELNNGNKMNGSFTIEKDKAGSQVGNYAMYSIYLMLKAMKTIDNKINKVKDKPVNNTSEQNPTTENNNETNNNSNGNKWSPQKLKKRKQSIKDIKQFKNENSKEELYNSFKSFINNNDLDVKKISKLNPNQMEEFRDYLFQTVG